MARVLSEIGRVHWNTRQVSWANWPDFYDTDDGYAHFTTPVEIGGVSVNIEALESGDVMMHVGFGGQAVSTWLDSKRPFYHPCYPVEWQTLDFIAWAERVFDELNRVDREHISAALAPTPPAVR